VAHAADTESHAAILLGGRCRREGAGRARGALPYPSHLRDGRKWAGEPPSKRKTLRDQFMRPEIESFFAFVESEWQRVKDQRGLLRSALGYAMNQKDALVRFLEDGRLKLDNNRSERALRKIAVGRKNWLFVGSDDHAASTAALLSMIASAKLHDLDPEEYLRDLFRVLPHWPAERYLELAPKSWPATRARLDQDELDAQIGVLTIPPAPTE
jgi:transposase